MNYVLLVLLALMAGFILWKKKGDLLSPGVLVVLVFLLSAFLLAMNTVRWNYTIRWYTAAVIIASLLLFWVGEYFGEKLMRNLASKNRCVRERIGETDPGCLEIDIRWFAALTALCVICVGAYILHQYKLSVELGNTRGILGMFSVVRVGTVRNPELAQLSIPMNLGISFTRAVGTVSLFILCQRLIHKQKKTLRYVIPVVLMVICMLMSGGRGGLIVVVAAVIFAVYHTMYHKAGNDERIRMKQRKLLLCCIILGVVAFIAAFWGFGYLIGHSSVLSFWDTISIYAGSPILCFDALLGGDMQIESLYFGQHTFSGLYNILRRIIPSIPVTPAHMEMVRWEGFSSNVYTSFFPYYVDFGVVGVFVMQLLVGALLGAVWYLFQKVNKKSTLIIYYGKCFGYACAMYSIAERLCSSVLALNFFAELFFAFFIVVLLVRPVRQPWSGLLNRLKRHR